MPGQISQPCPPLAPFLDVILLPVRGLATLDHHDLEQGPSCQLQLSSSGCHGTLVLLQKPNRQSPPGRHLLLLRLLPPRVPGAFWGPWERSLGSWEGAPLTFELPFSLPLVF